MTAPRIARAISAFNPSTRYWAPVSIPSIIRQEQGKQTLTLTTWNIDAFSSRPVARATHILDRILQEPNPPDIIFLQEVTREVCASLLRDPRIRDGFLTTDSEDESSFKAVPFATMTLLSRTRFTSELTSQKETSSQPGFRVKLPSRYGRDGLCVDVDLSTSESPNTILRLINVHLESLEDPPDRRTEQVTILAGVLREPGCAHGIMAGDFNAISSGDRGLVDNNQLVDAWVAVHSEPKPDAATWGVGMRIPDGLQPGRLDKITMVGLEAVEIEILRPGLIGVPKPGEREDELLWSDHCGLRCTFNI